MSDETDDEKGGSNTTLELIGGFKTDRGSISVQIGMWTDANDVAYPPSIRINRVTMKKGEPKIKSLGSIKDPAEAEQLAPLLLKAAKALAKVLKS